MRVLSFVNPAVYRPKGLSWLIRSIQGAENAIGAAATLMPNPKRENPAFVCEWRYPDTPCC